MSWVTRFRRNRRLREIRAALGREPTPADGFEPLSIQQLAVVVRLARALTETGAIWALRLAVPPLTADADLVGGIEEDIPDRKLLDAVDGIIAKRSLAVATSVAEQIRPALPAGCSFEMVALQAAAAAALRAQGDDAKAIYRLNSDVRQNAAGFVKDLDKWAHAEAYHVVGSLNHTLASLTPSGLDIDTTQCIADVQKWLLENPFLPRRRQAMVQRPLRSECRAIRPWSGGALHA